MIWIVFFICLFNLFLGFGLEIYLRQRAVHMPMPVRARARKAPPKTVAVEPIAELALEPPPEPPVSLEQVEAEIPEEWYDLLEEENVVAGSFVEASVQVLRLEVGRYRKDLIAIDDQVRACQKNPDADLMEPLLQELKELNQSWLDQQAEASACLTGKSDNLGQFESMGNDLEDVLLEQAAQIETTCSNIDQLDFSSDIDDGCRRLILEIRRLLDLAHELRDRMQDSLLAIVKAEDRLTSISRALQFDGSTGLYSRAGLEKVFQDFRQDGSALTRQISCALIDIDRFGKLLEIYGAIPCDRLLAAFAGLLADAVRKERGFDVTARFDGQRFICFFGDTGPHNATSAVERTRQMIEVTKWELDEERIDLTVSIGVAELRPGDAADGFFDRLKRTVREAKKAGRNRTFLDEGKGPKAVNPPQYNVKSKVIPVR